MRGHSHLLDAQSKMLFRRWQQQHQYQLVSTTDRYSRVIVKDPIGFELRAHKMNGFWHIPFTDGKIQLSHQTFELPSCWLCLKLKP